MIKLLLHLDRSRRQSIRPRTEIRRRWVETADERCPLACMWSPLPEEYDEQDDDSGLPWSAFSRFGWKAGLLHSIHHFFGYSFQRPVTTS
jgi:hypothetical protein